MSRKPTHTRPDANQGEIVDALLRAGASVLDLHDLGIRNAPDILVGYQGRDWLMEIKTATGRVRRGQRDWHEWWSGRPPRVVRSAEDALRVIGAL